MVKCLQNNLKNVNTFLHFTRSFTEIGSWKRTNLSANQKRALKTLKTNSEINLKKADKGTTTVVMDTTQKIEEGRRTSLQREII